MKVNEETRRIIGKQLPWLPALIPNNTVEFVVQLIDVNTLSLRQKGVTHDEEWCSWDRVLLITGSGQVLGEIGKMTAPVKRWTLTGGFPFFKKIEILEEVPFPESVEGALLRISGSEDVRYILQIESDTLRHGPEEDRYPVATLHKLPKKGPNLKVWLKQKAAEETTRLQEKLAEADE